MILYSLTPWERFKKYLGVAEHPNPGVFFARAWQSLAVSMWCCIGLALWFYIQSDPGFNTWLAMAALLASGPMNMSVASLARVPDRLRRHIAKTSLCILFVFLFAWLVQATNPALLGVVLWLMPLLLVYQARMHDSRERSWTAQENKLAVGCTFFAIAAFVASPYAPFFIPSVLACLVAVQGWCLWYFQRSLELSLEQHATVWPRASDRKSVV